MLLDAFGQPPRWSLTLTPSASQVMVVWKVLFTAVLVSSCTLSAVDRGRAGAAAAAAAAADVAATVAFACAAALSAGSHSLWCLQ